MCFTHSMTYSPFRQFSHVHEVFIYYSNRFVSSRKQRQLSDGGKRRTTRVEIDLRIQTTGVSTGTVMLEERLGLDPCLQPNEGECPPFRSPRPCSLLTDEKGQNSLVLPCGRGLRGKTSTTTTATVTDRPYFWVL